MGLLDKIIDIGYGMIEHLADKALRGFELAKKETFERCGRFLELLESKDVPGALKEVADAVSAITDAIREVPQPFMVAFREITGIEVTPETLWKGLQSIGGFLKEVISGVVELPAEALMSIMVPLVTAVVHLAYGNFAAGAYSLGIALIRTRDALANQPSEVQSRNPIPESLRALRLQPRFEAMAADELPEELRNLQSRIASGELQ